MTIKELQYGTVGPKCWYPETGYQQSNCCRTQNVTATKPGVANCDGRHQTWYPETERQT